MGDVYKLGEGDANAGTLAFNAENNIPAPDGGLYFFDVSLKALTYKLTAIGDEIYVAGLNKLEGEDWTFEPLPATATGGVYSVVSLSPNRLPGDLRFIFLTETGIMFMAEVPENSIIRVITASRMMPRWHRTYTLTIDLINATYTIE
ncbi:cadherin repeat domain-containing protein [Bacteroides stercorirosoris]|uniref:hypothetical protein n=1 Tax=Bacteroides stercorirosoris TaxID=871324 RepID=UPI001FB1616F|nr:hypothetical protein [Bacteroides stercorirosoris]